MIFADRPLLCLVVFASGIHRCASFYLPGVNPQSFDEFDIVKLKVNVLTSDKTLFPLDYYRLPLCQPYGGPKMDNQNLGEMLAGDRFQSSPYVLHMKRDVYCQHLCVTNLGRGEMKGMVPNRVVKAIRNGYHHNWIMDNMDSAFKTEKVLPPGEVNEEGSHENTTEIPSHSRGTMPLTVYRQGFPVGFIDDNTKQAQINNHVNIEVMYNAIPWDVKGRYRVVGLVVQPFSIDHKFDIVEDNEQDPFKIRNPIPSCNISIPINQRQHTSSTMLHGRQTNSASGKVLFTYDVVWIENPNVHWASRWDTYLQNGMIDHSTTHFENIDSIIFLAILVVVIIGKVLMDRNKTTLRVEPESEEGEEPNTLASPLLPETGESAEATNADLLTSPENSICQPFVIQDIFRPPLTSPVYFAVALGTGLQLICTLVIVICMAGLGFLSAPRRGSLVMSSLICFCIFGCVAGYVTGRVHRLFHGGDKLPLYRLTVVGLPGLFFGMLCIRQLVCYWVGSTLAMPISSIMIIFFLGLLILYPSTSLGVYFGYHGKITMTDVFHVIMSFFGWIKTIHHAVYIGFLFFFLAAYFEDVMIVLFAVGCPMIVVGFVILLIWIAEQSDLFSAFNEMVPVYTLGLIRPTSKGSWVMTVPSAIGIISQVSMVANTTEICVKMIGIGTVILFLCSKDSTWPHIYTGILPYAVLYPYYCSLFGAFWRIQYYDPSGVTLLLASLLYLATVGVVGILYTYRSLQIQIDEPRRYHWWYTFCASGSNALYFTFQPGPVGPHPTLSWPTVGHYIGNMALLAFCMFLVSGAWGSFCSIWFIRRVFKLTIREIEDPIAQEELELHPSEGNARQNTLFSQHLDTSDDVVGTSNEATPSSPQDSIEDGVIDSSATASLPQDDTTNIGPDDTATTITDTAVLAEIPVV